MTMGWRETLGRVITLRTRLPFPIRRKSGGCYFSNLPADKFHAH